MAEDSTRRLLKVFGVAVTECEDALAELTAAVGGSPEASLAAAAEAYGHAAREVSARWLEVSQLIHGYQARAQQAIERHLRGSGAR